MVPGLSPVPTLPDESNLYLQGFEVGSFSLIIYTKECSRWRGGGICISQCWTEGRSSLAVAEDFRPTATATVAEV